MNRMIRTIPFVLLLFSCGPGTQKDQAIKTTKADSVAKNPKGERVVTSTYPDGKVKAEIPYKNGMKNGIAKSYASDGTLVLELPYVNNIREGISKKYYPGGTVIAQTTEYKNDKLNGFQTKYRGNGNVMSEQRYENDYACSELREYLENKSLKKKYPTIDVKVEDKLKTNGTYKLKISLSERVRSVKFYEGKLSSTGCMSDRLNYLLFDEATKTAEVSWFLPPGAFLMEEVNIIAAYETLMGNTAIAQHKYNVAIDNK